MSFEIVDTPDGQRGIPPLFRKDELEALATAVKSLPDGKSIKITNSRDKSYLENMRGSLRLNMLRHGVRIATAVRSSENAIYISRAKEEGQ